MIIDLFHSRYTDYNEILENYIQKHFAHAKVYFPLLAQIRKISDKIYEGLTENTQNEEKNSYVLLTMKYIGTILKIIRNSYLEALSCQESIPEGDNSRSFSR